MYYHAQNVPVVHPVRVAPASEYAGLPTLPMTHEGGGLYSLRGETVQEVRAESSNVFNIDSAWSKSNAGTYTIDSSYVSTKSIQPFGVQEGKSYVLITKGITADADYSSVFFGSDNLTNSPNTHVLGVQAGYHAFDVTERRIVLQASKTCTITKIMVTGSKLAAGLYTVNYIGVIESAQPDISYEPYYPARPSPDPGGESPLVNTYRAGTYQLDLGGIRWLLTLDDDLRSAGDAADVLYMDIYSRSAWVESLVKSIDLDKSTLSIYPNTGNEGYQSYVMRVSDLTGETKGRRTLCSRFEWAEGLGGYAKDCQDNYGTSFNICVRKDRMEGFTDDLTLDEKSQLLRQWLQANPTEVYYQLAAPEKYLQAIVELDLQEDATTIALDKTVNAKMEYLAIEGVSDQETVEAGKNLVCFPDYISEGSFINGLICDGNDRIAYTHRTQTWTGIKITGLDAGKTYTLSYNLATSLSGGYCRTVVNGQQTRFNTQAGISKRIEVPISGAEVVNLQTLASADSVNEIVFTNLQLELGDTATSYEPYRPASPSPDNPSPILSLEEFDISVCGRSLIDRQVVHIPFALRAIGQAKDQLIVDLTAGSVAYYQSVYSLPLTGAEKYRMNYTMHNCARYYTTISGAYAPGGEGNYEGAPVNCLCTHFIGAAFDNAFKNFGCLGVASWESQVESRIDISVTYDQIGAESSDPLDLVAKLEAYLADQAAQGTPVTVQYLLATPIITDITDTETGQVLLRLSTCYPDSIIAIECANGLSGQMEAQVKVLGRGQPN